MLLFCFNLLLFPILQNLLTSNPSVAAVFSTKEQLVPLFDCLALPVPAESKILQICLTVFSLLTKHAACVEAMVGERSNLILLLQLLHCNPTCRDGALAVLYSLASSPELAWAAAKHGGVVYILELILPVQGKLVIFVYSF
jgi:DnaJ homolog subfamily C member 13